MPVSQKCIQEFQLDATTIIEALVAQAKLIATTLLLQVGSFPQIWTVKDKAKSKGKIVVKKSDPVRGCLILEEVIYHLTNHRSRIRWNLFGNPCKELPTPPGGYDRPPMKCRLYNGIITWQAPDGPDVAGSAEADGTGMWIGLDFQNTRPLRRKPPDPPSHIDTTAEYEKYFHEWETRMKAQGKSLFDLAPTPSKVRTAIRINNFPRYLEATIGSFTRYGWARGGYYEIRLGIYDLLNTMANEAVHTLNDDEQNILKPGSTWLSRTYTASIQEEDDSWNSADQVARMLGLRVEKNSYGWQNNPAYSAPGYIPIGLEWMKKIRGSCDSSGRVGKYPYTTRAMQQARTAAKIK
ncbi:MAG: hypothetical protein ACNI3A_18280 [Desulfovibrio sp.]|uniref:hypothetical protein n=1 Tax=Desulfovibrio sp. 7SRBS1 TaxID=3378064 RepID=UPI003B3F206B